jgi:hypothetical protein
MLEIATIGVFMGATLAVMFRVIAVVVAVPAVTMIIAATGITHGRSGWWIAIAMAVGAASIQIGYVGGAMLLFAVRNRHVAAKLPVSPRKRMEESLTGQP